MEHYCGCLAWTEVWGEDTTPCLGLLFSTQPCGPLLMHCLLLLSCAIVYELCLLGLPLKKRWVLLFRESVTTPHAIPFPAGWALGAECEHAWSKAFLCRPGLDCSAVICTCTCLGLKHPTSSIPGPHRAVSLVSRWMLHTSCRKDWRELVCTQPAEVHPALGHWVQGMSKACCPCSLDTSWWACLMVLARGLRWPGTWLSCYYISGKIGTENKLVRPWGWQESSGEQKGFTKAFLCVIEAACSCGSCRLATVAWCSLRGWVTLEVFFYLVDSMWWQHLWQLSQLRLVVNHRVGPSSGTGKSFKFLPRKSKCLPETSGSKKLGYVFPPQLTGEG